MAQQQQKNKKKAEIKITPAGRALWPRLTEPDYTYKKEYGEYSVGLLLTEKEARPIMDEIKELQQTAYNGEFERRQADKPLMDPEKIKEKMEFAAVGIKAEEDQETGIETGNYILTFKLPAAGISDKTGKPWKRQPALFDASRKPISPEGLQIWSGSTVKVAYTLSPFYRPIGAGVSLRLEAVQIIDLVNAGMRNAGSYGFGEEDGYAHEEEEGGDDHNPAFNGFEGGDNKAGGDF